VRIDSSGVLRDRRRARGVGLGILAALTAVGGFSTAAEATRPIAAAQSSTVQLVQAYLAALGPAGSRLSKVEVALKALGPSATRAQVLAAVASLGPALAPIEALLTAPPPTTLEALGQPQIVGNKPQLPYRTVAEGAHLDVGSTLYPNGFQIRTSEALTKVTWHLHARYTTLSFQIGVDALSEPPDSGAYITLSDGTGTAMPITYQGKLVLGALIQNDTHLESVTLDVAHESDVQLGFRSFYEGFPVLDVVNDRLT
jgi:hypothetical protein